MDALGRMLNLLPYYLQSGENIAKFYKVLAHLYDDLVNVFIEIIDSRNIDKSKLYGLDIIGDIVGEKRNGLEDEKFRENIKTKIRRNRSNGDIETLNDFARSILDADFTGFNEENESAKLNFKYNFPRENYSTKDPVVLMEKIIAVGVQLKVLLAVQSNNLNYTGNATMQSNKITIKTQFPDEDINMNINVGAAAMQSNKISISTEV